MSGLPADGDDVPFPGWDVFEDPDSADIDESTKASLLETFVPSPAGVLADTVQLTGEGRFAVPVTAVCPEYSPDDLRGWLDAGDLLELARASNMEMVDIDSGHWPQITAPDRLSELLLAAVDR